MKRVVTYGLETAVDHTYSYLGRYLLIGLAPILLVAWGFDRSGPAVAFVLILVHAISAAVMFPAAIVINLIALRFARGRTWDRHPWRAWLGGVLGVVLVWGSYSAAIAIDPQPPEVLTRMVGSDIAAMIHGLGILLTASAAALVTAWLVPSSRTRQVQ